MAKILFLYSEMMPYMEAVINSLVVDYGNEVCVVSWDKKRLTPHNPKYPISVKSFNRSEFDVAKLKELIKRFNPGLIYVSGRMDKIYLITKPFHKQQIFNQSQFTFVTLCFERFGHNA